MVVIPGSHHEGNIGKGLNHSSIPTEKRMIESAAPRVKRSVRIIAFFLLGILAYPLSLLSKSPFLNVFPDSPAISQRINSALFSYTQLYSSSGSQWATGLDEQEVFFASLKHAEDADTSWEIRIGKGGQLYSIRGPFGESQAPQAQPNAHWIDQIFQLVGVNLAKNKSAAGHPYFIHQAGDYLNDPILKATFYSPMLASEFDASGRMASALTWGQQAHFWAMRCLSDMRVVARRDTSK